MNTFKNSRKDRFNSLYSPQIPVVSYEENTLYSLLPSSESSSVTTNTKSNSSSTSSDSLPSFLSTVPSTVHIRRNSVTDLAAELAKDRGKNVVQLAGAYVVDHPPFPSSSQLSSSSAGKRANTIPFSPMNINRNQYTNTTQNQPQLSTLDSPSSVSTVPPPFSSASSPMVARAISRVLHGPPPLSPFAPTLTTTTAISSSSSSASVTVGDPNQISSATTNRRPVLGLSSKAGSVINQFGYLIDYNLEDLSLRTGYNREQLYSHWLRYKAICALSKSDIGIDRETFREHIPCLTVEDDAFVNRVFTLLDVDGSGTIEWEEFLTTLTALEKGSKDLRTEFLFKSYDKDGTGKLTVENIYEYFVASLFMNRQKAEIHRPEATAILRNFAERIFLELDTAKKGNITLQDALEHIRNNADQEKKNANSTVYSGSSSSSSLSNEDISALFGRVMIVGKEADPATLLEIDMESQMAKSMGGTTNSTSSVMNQHKRTLLNSTSSVPSNTQRSNGSSHGSIRSGSGTSPGREL